MKPKDDEGEISRSLASQEHSDKMANLDHISILQRGIAAWNKWREDHPDVQPDLSRNVELHIS
jgi:hypothetical protein